MFLVAFGLILYSVVPFKSNDAEFWKSPQIPSEAGGL